MKAWQHDETGRITKAPESPGQRWVEIPMVFANIDQLRPEFDVLCDCGGNYYTAERVRKLTEQAQQHAYAEGRKDERAEWEASIQPMSGRPTHASKHSYGENCKECEGYCLAFPKWSKRDGK